MPDPGYRLARQPHVPGERRHAAALVHGDRRITFAELDERAAAFAAAAVEAGLVPGDRVLLLMPNAPETFEMLIGCARAGLVGVPVNWRLAADEARTVAGDAQARAVVADPSLSALLGSVTDGLDVRLTVRLGRSTTSGCPDPGPPRSRRTPDRTPLSCRSTPRAPAGGPRAC